MTTIAEVASELREIARSAPDASGHFPALYSRVTQQIAESINRGEYENGQRMERFAVAFAAFYTRAMRTETRAPRCWEATWDVADDEGLLIVQHLLLGINAHVNYDLPQAVVDVAGEGGDLGAVRADFDAVNDVLAMAYVGIIRDLDRVSRWADEVARLGGSRVFNFSLRVARARAWESAERLHPLRGKSRADYLKDLDGLVAVLAYLITRPKFPGSVLVRLARRLEERSATKVTAALLGEGD